MLALERASETYRTGAFGGGRLVAVREADFSIAPGRGGVADRGERQRQVHDRPDDPAPDHGQRGPGHPTARTSRRCADPPCAPTTASCRACSRTVQLVQPMFMVAHVFSLLRTLDTGAADDMGPPDGGGAGQRGPRGRQVLHKYPHQLSGGQLQRILIAPALLLDTRFLVRGRDHQHARRVHPDRRPQPAGRPQGTRPGHPVSSPRPVTRQLHQRAGRDPALRRGRIVESGPTVAVFGNPLHPYTQQLLGRCAAATRSGAAARTRTTGAALPYHESLGSEAAGGQPALVEVEPGCTWWAARTWTDRVPGMRAGTGHTAARPGPRERGPAARASLRRPVRRAPGAVRLSASTRRWRWLRRGRAPTPAVQGCRPARRRGCRRPAPTPGPRRRRRPEHQHLVRGPGDPPAPGAADRDGLDGGRRCPAALRTRVESVAPGTAMTVRERSLPASVGWPPAVGRRA